MEKIVQINNLKTRIWVEGEGKPLLILHGWGKGLDAWKKAGEILSEKFQVIIPDLPGFGQSQSPPSFWSLKEYCEFVKGLVNFFDLSKIILVGHSFGGRIAIKLASNPQNFFIEKLILIDSAGIKRKRFVKQIILIFSKILKKVPIFQTRILKKVIYRRILKSDYFDAKPEMKEVLKNILKEDLKKFLPKITIPTLIIWGEKDRITPLKDAFLLNQMIPKSKLEILPKVGHSPHIEAPELLASTIIKFLSE